MHVQQNHSLNNPKGPFCSKCTSFMHVGPKLTTGPLVLVHPRLVTQKTGG